VICAEQWRPFLVNGKTVCEVSNLARVRNHNTLYVRKMQRMPRGTRHWKSVLSNDQVLSIRGRKTFRGCIAEWAKEFGVSRYVISDVVSGKTYRQRSASTAQAAVAQ
jgi:hypothetical protein